MTAVDPFVEAQRVADAVLCEGQVLYPYRASAAKNQLRWQWGVLAPRGFAEQEGSDRWAMRARGLLDGGRTNSALTVRARFVRTQARTVEVDGEPVSSAEAAGQLWTTFDETVEAAADVGPVALGELLAGPVETAITLPARCEEGRPSNDVRVTWRAERLDGRVVVEAEPVDGPFGLVQVTATCSNETAWAAPDGVHGGQLREHALRRSMVSTHLLLAVSGGRWLSAIDPPEFAASAAPPLPGEGCFPVLVAEDNVLLASPIILYDHPEVAPESTGDFCDATEIDEILALRTLALTEDEKREARATDRRAAEIVERVDHLPPELWARLHGAVRSMRPTSQPGDATVRIGGRDVGPGVPVRLRPRSGGDAQDAFVAGRTATIAGVFHDLDGAVHLAVVVDGDPGADLLDAYGRYRYFHPDEVEVL